MIKINIKNYVMFGVCLIGLARTGSCRAALVEHRQWNLGAHQAQAEPARVERQDYYKVLGVPRDASPEQIRKAYRVLAKKYNCDHNKGREDIAERYRQIVEAHAVLSNPEKRRIYDQAGFGGLDREVPQHAEPENETPEQLFQNYCASRGLNSGDAWNKPYEIHNRIEYEFRGRGIPEDMLEADPVPSKFKRCVGLLGVAAVGALHGYFNNVIRRKLGQEAKVFYKAPLREWASALFFMSLGTMVRDVGIQRRFAKLFDVPEAARGQLSAGRRAFMFLASLLVPTPMNRKERMMTLIGNLLYISAQTAGEMSPLPGYPQVGKFEVGAAWLWPLKDLFMF